MFLELALVEQRFIGVPVDLEDVRVFDCGYALTVQHLLYIEDALAHLLRRNLRDEMSHQVHRGLFLEYAGWIAPDIAINCPCRWVDRRDADMSQLECSRIRDSVMTGGVDQPHGVIGRDGIEVGSRDVTLFTELAFVPPGAGDPFARLDQRNLGFHASNNVSHGSGV